jgi:hypothetical protein
MLLRARARRKTFNAASRVTNKTKSHTQLRQNRDAKLTTTEPPQAAPKQTTAPTIHSDSDSSTDLYFRAQANHRPGMGESNAESVLREEEINQDVKRMKRERTLRTKRGKQRRHSHTLNNNVTEVNLHTDYSLYENPDKYPTPHPVPVIYDTGAAISMLSSEPGPTSAIACST